MNKQEILDDIEKIIGNVHYDALGTGMTNGKLHEKMAEAIVAAGYVKEVGKS